MAKRRKSATPVSLQAALEAAPKTPVDVTKTEEQWNTYTLEDGSVLSVKPVVVEVRRAQGVYNEDGTPAYVLSVAIIVRTTAPTALKKKSRIGK